MKEALSKAVRQKPKGAPGKRSIAEPAAAPSQRGGKGARKAAKGERR